MPALKGVDDRGEGVHHDDIMVVREYLNENYYG